MFLHEYRIFEFSSMSYMVRVLSIYEVHVIMSEISVSIVITVRRCIEYIMHISMNILVLYCYICS